MKNLNREVKGRKDGVSFIHICSYTVVFVRFLQNCCLINGTPSAWGHRWDGEIEFACGLETFGEEG